MQYLCTVMKIRSYIQKAAFVLLLALGMQAVNAAFTITGLADERAKNSKYSLKNLSSLSHKSLSFSSLRSTLQFKGLQPGSVKETTTGLEFNSMLRYDNGNSTYIYPYKFKVKTSKFKTPAPQR
jgi:hypothetical protein